MKTTLGAIAIALSLVAGIGAANAVPVSDSSSDWVNVFEPK